VSGAILSAKSGAPRDEKDGRASLSLFAASSKNGPVSMIGIPVCRRSRPHRRSARAPDRGSSPSSSSARTESSSRGLGVGGLRRPPARFRPAAQAFRPTASSPARSAFRTFSDESSSSIPRAPLEVQALEQVAELDQLIHYLAEPPTFSPVPILRRSGRILSDPSTASSGSSTGASGSPRPGPRRRSAEIRGGELLQDAIAPGYLPGLPAGLRPVPAR
jgi:hypothetical protein